MSEKRKKPFDFSRFKQRHVALKILYFGWDSDGLAEQVNCDNTIEHHLFHALTTTCLVESRQKCSYNRCGRTDKGVSSYGQVVNLNVRSNLLDESKPQNVGLFTPPLYINDITGVCDRRTEEINYVDTLNRVLPDYIRVIAWAPVDAKFSSRFDCQSRSYSYVFPKGDLSLELMQDSLTYLIGEHDFRNLCSFDLKNGVTNHKRTIMEAKIAEIRPIGHGAIPEGNSYDFCEVVITGKAFLYHQIRCIMTIVFLIGSRKERPELMRDLLDIEKCPARPNYNRASSLPLSLFDCRYKPDKLPLGWIYDQSAICNVYKKLKQLWLRYRTKALMIERVLMDLESNNFLGDNTGRETILHGWKDFGLEFDTMSDVKYVPVMKRPRDESLESKLKTLNKKKQRQANVVSFTAV